MSRTNSWLLGPVWILSLGGCAVCPQPPQVAVAVEVVDETGTPIDDAEVECAGEGEPFEPGIFCIGPPGRYTVRVTRGDQAEEREVDVAADGNPACELPDTEYVTIVLPDQSAP